MIMPTSTRRFKRVIIDIDTQRHFFMDTGVVCVSNHRRILSNIRRTMAWARLQKIRMISTVQICGMNTPFCVSCKFDPAGQKKIHYTLRNRNTRFDACDSTDLPLKLFSKYDQLIFSKRCFDPFEEPRIDRILTELDADEFILIGAATEGAVKATALGLLARQKKITIIVDAIGAYDPKAAKTILHHLWAKGTQFTDTQAFLGSSGLQFARGCSHNYQKI